MDLRATARAAGLEKSYEQIYSMTSTAVHGSAKLENIYADENVLQLIANTRWVSQFGRPRDPAFRVRQHRRRFRLEEARWDRLGRIPS